MNSKENYADITADKLVNKINDLVIGEDSNDYLTVNSETRFHSDVNIGGSSIRLHSSDNTNSNNFISILDQNIHSVHAQTLRKIQDLQIGDNNGKYLKFDNSSGLVASTVSGGGGGGSGIVNNRIDGDLTIGEDDSEMLTIASKLHIPGGTSGQVLTKGTDGSIEYGPTAFDSVTLPDGGGVIKEKIARYCNGDTISTKQGNMTLQNVTTIQALTNPGYTDINGSEINYHPPTGTTCVIYEFECYYTRQWNGGDDAPIGHFRFYIDDVEQENSRITIGSVKKEGNISLKVLINITGSTDSNNLTLNSWTSIKKLHWTGREYDGNHEVDLHKIKHWDGGNESSNIIKPSIIITAIKEGATTFTTANPLLANPSTADKGKIVTVNAAGDDLQYGPQVLKHNMNFKNIYETGVIAVQHSSANNNPKVHPKMNITITPQLTTSKVMITVNIMGEWTYQPSEGMAFLRRTINGVVTDIFPPVVGNSNRGLGQFVTSHIDTQVTDTMEVCNFHYIDEPNTISEVRYDVMLVAGHNSASFHYNKVSVSTSDYWDERGMSFISAEERFANDDGVVGALTSFTQEQALAGAGGTAAFTNAVSGIDTNYGSKDNLVDNKLYSDSSNSSLYQDQLCSLLKGGNAYWFYSVTFTTPQIVTKYRIWGRGDGSTSNQNPRDWEFRAATDSSTYNATDSTTYTVLDSQVSATFNSYTSTANASDNLSLGNVYNLSTIGAYKYYVLHITANGNNAGTGNHSTHCTMSEIALYGGGFTIPSQVGHTGRLLTTDGTSLGWSTTSALPSVTVPEPTSTNKGRALVSTGTGIEFSDFNSGVSTGFKVYKSGTAFEEVTTNTAVLFDQTTTNVGAGSYSTTAGTYTVPVTGYYNIFANFTLPTIMWQGLSTTNNTQYLGEYIFTAYNNPSFSQANYVGFDFVNETNGAFNASTGLFTCQIKGRYRINAAIVQGNHQNNRGILYLYKNGNNFLQIVDTKSDADDVGREVIVDLDVNDVIYLRRHSNTTYFVQNCTFSGELIKTLNYRIQKSTNSGTTYIDLVSSSDKPTTSIVESLNQNNLIRVISGDGSTGSILNLQQGTTKNSFGAHLLNSGNSTSPIPIYGFLANKDGDLTISNTNNTDITTWVTNLVGGFAKPSANFNNSTGVYTIPVTGFYQVNGIVKINNLTTGDVRLKININNASSVDSNDQVGSFITTDNDNKSLVVSTTCKLNINDTIKLTIKSSNDTSYQVSTESTFSCFLLASDTQTNTRQMGLSSIVPLHQLGHDQFADGTLTRFFISQGIDPDNLKNYRTGDGTQIQGTQNPIIPNSTQPINSTFTSSTLYYNYNGTNYTTVPASPYSSSSSPNWDYQDYIYLQPILNTNAHSNTYTCGSFTIDTSKILENYTGLWELTYTNSEGIRFKINGETFYNNTDSDGSTTTFGLYQKYINVEYVIYDIGSTENLIFQFHQTKADNHIQIAEPVMPSITLPTPNSVNSGKVLVSNGSEYALENSGARNQSYIACHSLNADDSVDGSEDIITDWKTSNLIIVGDNFTFNSGIITIKSVGKYRIKSQFSCATTGSDDARYIRIRVYLNDSYTYNSGTLENLSHLSYEESGNNYGEVAFDRILDITTQNTTVKFGVTIYNSSTAKVFGTSPSFSIEDMTPSAVPSINVPLPVAAHAGKALTVNSAGTALEYGDPREYFKFEDNDSTSYSNRTILSNGASDGNVIFESNSSTRWSNGKYQVLNSGIFNVTARIRIHDNETYMEYFIYQNENQVDLIEAWIPQDSNGRNFYEISTLINCNAGDYISTRSGDYSNKTVENYVLYLFKVN